MIQINVYFLINVYLNLLISIKRFKYYKLKATMNLLTLENKTQPFLFRLPGFWQGYANLAGAIKKLKYGPPPDRIIFSSG